jgi:nucleotide-binding universal stress UspA family protein
METFTYFVPVDFTECCYNALQYTTTLARSSGGTVKLCHVVDLEEIPESDNPVIVSFALDRLLQEARKKMKSLREIIFMEGVHVKEEIVLGDLQTELMKQIDSANPGVIVIGRDSDRQVTSNSLLTYLTRNTHAPVLVVPHSNKSGRSNRAILTLAIDSKKSGKFSSWSSALRKLLSDFSVLEVRSLRFGNGKEALNWIEKMRSKGSVSPKFLSHDSDKAINQMIEFIRANKIDLFCIQENRNIFSKLFGQNFSNHLPTSVEGPLLVITL